MGTAQRRLLPPWYARRRVSKHPGVRGDLNEYPRLLAARRIARTEACPIEEFMDMLGGRWKVFILWELIQGPRRSGELRKSIPPITQKVFVEQLRDLEDNGLVKRTVFPTVPPRVEYEVTELGQSLRGILKDMCHWSSANMEKIRECRRTRRLELVEK